MSPLPARSRACTLASTRRRPRILKAMIAGHSIAARKAAP